MTDHCGVRLFRLEEFGKLREFGRSLVKAKLCPEEKEEAPVVSIVTVGGQSAGKSALVSMLSGIKLESTVNCTTRGPTIFRFRSHRLDLTECKIRIERLENHAGIPMQKPSVYKAEELDFADLENIQKTIKRYQRLVLQPSTDEDDEDGLEPDIPIGTEMQLVDKARITRNRVVIEVTGSGFPRINIVDLPGQNVEQHRGRLLEISRSYMADPNTIILAAVPVTEEAASQDILNHVASIDPSYSRSIIVLTKADRLHGEDCSWIAEKQRPVCYTAVAQPTGLRSSIDQRREDEKVFFDNEKGTKASALSQVSENDLGFSNLERKIDIILSKLTKARLSKRIVKLREEEAVTARSLEPCKIANPIKVINAIVDRVDKSLSRILEEFESALAQGSVFEDLLDNLRDSIPLFVPFYKDTSGFEEWVKREEWDNAVIQDLGTIQDLGKGAFTTLCLRSQANWKAAVERVVERIWLDLQEAVIECCSGDYPILMEVLRSHVIALIKQWRSENTVVVQTTCMRYTSDLAPDLTRIDEQRALWSACASSPPVTPRSVTDSPLTPPPFIKRKSAPSTEFGSPIKKYKSEHLAEMDKAAAQDHAFRLNLHLPTSAERLVQVLRDDLSYQLRRLSQESAADYLRDAIGTNSSDANTTQKLLDLLAPAAIDREALASRMAVLRPILAHADAVGI